MKNRTLKTTLLFLIGVLLNGNVISQRKLELNTESTMSIYGTSNVHDWSEHVNGIKGEINLYLEDNVVTKISSLMFTTKVVDIKSGKGTMDEYTHEALKYKSHVGLAEKH